MKFAMENVTSFPPQAKSNGSQQAWNYVNNGDLLLFVFVTPYFRHEDAILSYHAILISFRDR